MNHSIDLILAENFPEAIPKILIVLTDGISNDDLV